MLENMKTAIFDMDGTVLDSMEEWRKLNISFVREAGVTLTKENEKDLYSMSGMMAVEYIRDKFDIEVPFSLLLERSSRLMEEPYRRGLPLKPGARAYLRRLGERGVTRVICTATPARLAMIALNRADLVREFDFICSTEMIGGGKHDPAFYDRLCAFLGLEREGCVMFEDALYAMKGAKEAGLGVVGVTDSTNLLDRKAIVELCDCVIDSFDELR